MSGPDINALLKIVYFDEQSASDYLDISAGGRAAATSEQVRERTVELNADVAAKVAARLSWLPFIGGSASVETSAEVSRVGESILKKTLSNTILTDYLKVSTGDDRIQHLQGYQVEALESSMAHLKMYTPYMVMARTEGPGLDFAKMDEAFSNAKGYYDLLATSLDGSAAFILRFNLRAFRNNYGLTDLVRMGLTYHGVEVGRARASELTMKAEMAPRRKTGPVTAQELLGQTAESGDPELAVLDVILAGVERAQ
jgi:hypothetical protein